MPKDMAATNFHRVQPIVEPVETMGEKPRDQNLHQAPGRWNLQQNIHDARNEKKASTENPRKNPTVRKTKKTQIGSRGPRESPSAAKAFNDPWVCLSSNTTTHEGKCTRAISPRAAGLMVERVAG